MQYFPYNPWRKYTTQLFDPLTATTAALSGIGTGLSAANTLAGGSYAAQAGQMKQAAANFEATQDIQNAAGETAAAQRQAIDTNQKANILRSSAVARAASGGVAAGTGSALTNQAQIAGRGSYQAGMDLWQGLNRASGLQNQAAAKQYSGYMDSLAGQEAQRASDLSAASTIAGGGASFLKMFGAGSPSSLTASVGPDGSGKAYPSIN
jgi:hypothetical protein